MPDIRPFRALRFDPEAVGDLSPIISPPYDVISPARQVELARRHPQNVVRLDLPLDEPGDEPESRYRRAARDLVAWRSQGLLRKDRESALYAYEQDYALPDGGRRTQRGFFARLRLEPYGPDGGILPHERTLSAPREDRYRLLRAVGVNISPVVLLYRDRPGGDAGRALADVASTPPLVEVTDDEGTRHRLWSLPASPLVAGSIPARLIDAASAAPLTIADGHHRYETALRYHDERHRDRQHCEEAPFDFTLALLLATSEPITVMATHRVLLGGPGGPELLEALGRLFDVEVLPSAEALCSAFPAGRRGPGPGEPRVLPGDAGSEAGGDRGAMPRLGLWTGGRAAVLRARRDAFEPLLDPAASETSRWLDVTVLATALERVAGLDRAATASGGRLAYTKDAAEAVAMAGGGSADAAFLLDPTPVEAVLRVAAAGEVMPQKSTYFYPKPVTGLVFNPHEW